MSSSSHTDRIMRLLDENDEFPPGWHDWHQKSPNDLNSKIMLIAIISLSVVVVVVILLHTYARCVLRRQTVRRAAALRRLGSTVARVHSTAETPKTGLEPSVIAALPVFVYGVGRQDGDADVECAVCLSMLEDEEIARLLPNCKHSFHAVCIDTWLISHPTCPICRTEAEPRMALQPEPREGPVANATPTAPPLEPVNSVLSCAEGTSEDGKAVTSGSISRMSSSFRRMLSRDRSSRRVQASGQEDGFEDLERQ
ncbi:E3 ubiquitin-protein ligase ATL41-like [Argentina anserina]|uniref:E3 ubiquitin-protein ligase ATL41-like n=1 Tax=Argentina anserina TaxID=57926 RepID=UPI0021765C00|nr:E3 ubiquitin-protein ligase ATL41-like [Potentilla anserina]